MKKTERYFLYGAFLLIGIFLLGACSPSQTAPTNQTTPDTATVSTATSAPQTPTSQPNLPGITIDQVRNAEYQLGAQDPVRTVQLTDGKYLEGAPGSTDYVSVTMTDFIARGDLNGDGENEAAAIVAEDYGSSGTFVFLAVYQYINQKPAFLTSLFLDDRPKINALSVENGEIYVDAVIHSKNDPMCCPTLDTKRHYFLNDSNLVLSDYSTEAPGNQPRAITIEAPVNGAQVSGLVRLKGSVTVTPAESNLIYHIYDLGGLELSVGPITVDAPTPGGPGTFEKAVDLGNILTNTSIRLAVEDLNPEDGSLFAMNSVLLQVK